MWLLILMLCVPWTSAAFTFNATDTDIVNETKQLFWDVAKVKAYQYANHVLPMHYISTLINDFEIFIVILLVAIIALFACSYYLASVIFYMVLILITIFVQTLFLFFTLSFFGKTIK
jgi:hypothetical protein